MAITSSLRRESVVNLALKLDDEDIEGALDLGNVQLGETRTILLYLHNREPDPLINMKPVLTEDFTVSDFPTDLLPNEQRPFQLHYSPTTMSVEGTRKLAKRNEQGELVLQVSKEYKGLLRVTGEVLRDRNP